MYLYPLLSFFLSFFAFLSDLLSNGLSYPHQSEYQRGVSAWNFDLEDLKAQASLVS
jgi:hypothetical protein